MGSYVNLYRGDSLACLHKISGPVSDKMRKDMIKTYPGELRLENNYHNKFKNR